MFVRSFVLLSSASSNFPPSHLEFSSCSAFAQCWGLVDMCTQVSVMCFQLFFSS